MADSRGDFELLGVAIVGTPMKCTDGASPSEKLFMVSPQNIRQLVAAYKDLRAAVAVQVGSAKANEVANLGVGDEWCLLSIWTRLDAKNFA